jgi:hypothetical protein
MRRLDDCMGSRSTRDFVLAGQVLSELRQFEVLQTLSSQAVTPMSWTLYECLLKWRDSSVVTDILDKVLTEIAAPQPVRRQSDPRETLREIGRVLTEEPLEDGEPHKAEAMLRDLVAQVGSKVAAAWQPTGDSEIDGGLVQCLGRLEPELVLPWGLTIVRKALQNDTARIRGAAIKAIELWATEDAYNLLLGHNDPAPWLADHVRRLRAR